MQVTYKYPSHLDARFKKLTGLFTAAGIGTQKRFVFWWKVYVNIFVAMYITLFINRIRKYDSFVAAFKQYALKSFLVFNNQSSTGALYLATISGVNICQ